MRSPRPVAIGTRLVGAGEPVLIVAEAGVNHDGDLRQALQLVRAAKDAGADAVKFQTFSAGRVASPLAPKSAHQIETTDAGESQLELLRRLELGADEHHSIAARCEELGIVFLSSPFDEESADLLDGLGVPAFKIASGEVTNWPLLAHVARKNKPILLSTGMADLDEVRGAVAAVAAAGDPPLMLLHCVSSYPAPAGESNLRAIETLRETFAVPVGYSDHTTGHETALAAVALGACVLEKHLTLDASLSGPDQATSLEPDAFARFVEGVRVVESSLGDGVKRPARSELATRDVARRSLVLTRDANAGEVVEPALLARLRPGTGIAPQDEPRVIGRRLKRGLRAGELLAWEDLE